jgi:hypothetical protein
MKEPNEEYIKSNYNMNDKYACTGKCKEFKDMTIPEINQEMNKGVFLTRWELLLASVGIAVLAREEIRKAIFDAGVYGNAILATSLIFFLSRNKK